MNDNDDKDVDNSDDFITIGRIYENPELTFMALFYLLLAWVTYYVMSVWLCI